MIQKIIINFECQVIVLVSMKIIKKFNVNKLLISVNIYFRDSNVYDTASLSIFSLPTNSPLSSM